MVNFAHNCFHKQKALVRLSKVVSLEQSKHMTGHIGGGMGKSGSFSVITTAAPAVNGSPVDLVDVYTGLAGQTTNNISSVFSTS